MTHLYCDCWKPYTPMMMRQYERPVVLYTQDWNSGWDVLTDTESSAWMEMARKSHEVCDGYTVWLTLM